MIIKPLHECFQMPTRGSVHAAGFDIYMPEDGVILPDVDMNDFKDRLIPLGFATAIPEGYYARLVVRSGSGVKHLIELANTEGIIDSDYRGEWKAALRTKNQEPFTYKKGDRLLQFIIQKYEVPVIEVAAELPETLRGEGGFNSTGR